MNLRLLFFISACLFSTGTWSQIGGTRTYPFLNLPTTARAASAGGTSMSMWGNDINLMQSNPSLLNKYMAKQATFNYCNFVGDINLFYVAYARDLGKLGVAGVGIQAFNYGTFAGYSEAGQKTGDFKAADYSINLSYAKTFADTNFQLGGSLKTIISQYDVYQSIGNAIDFGVTYHNESNLTLSLLVKNIGIVWKSYNNQNGSLPNTVQFGISKKVAKAPFRLFAVYDQLLKWNISYVSPVDTAGKSSFSLSSDSKDSTGFQKFSHRAGTFTGNFFKHLIIGTDIIFSKNFFVTVAYNYRRQVEMTIPDRRGVNGLSFGFTMRIKRIGFSYSFAKMAFQGNSNIFALTYSL